MNKNKIGNRMNKCTHARMMIVLLTLLIPSLLTAQKDWHPVPKKPYIILSEQSENKVAIVDVTTSEIVWEWVPSRQIDIAPEHAGWFRNMSDAKPVKNREYILACASGGGVALIRIADKRTMFYAYAGGNTHSIELMPDGNIVSASSTGNLMRIFIYNDNDYPDNVKHVDYYLFDGHNLVWDDKRQLLYTVSDNLFTSYQYESGSQPALAVKDSMALPEGHAHDLYWDFKKKNLLLSSDKSLFAISIPGIKATRMPGTVVNNIKSISTGPKGYPTIVIQPKESWWTDEVLDINGRSIFKKKGLKIYKARWLL